MLVSLDTFKDAFGEDVMVGDTVIFMSYRGLAKGVVSRIEYNNGHVRYNEKWAIYVRKENGPSYGTKAKQDSRVRLIHRIAKV